MKILTQQEGPLWIITINRPEVRNCIDGETANLLEKAWLTFRDREDLSVAIITGSGDDSFCSGADLKQIETLGPTSQASVLEKRRFITHGTGYLGYTRQTDIYKPILAAINGYAVAGGLEIACLADIRIASENAQFSVACRRWNVPLVDGGTQRLPRIVGLGWAMDLILTGKFISAQEAHRIGLVNEIVPLGQTLKRAKEIATLLSELPQEAMRTDKQAVLTGLGKPLDEGLRIEAEVGQTALNNPKMKEGVRAFLEKRNR